MSHRRPRLPAAPKPIGSARLDELALAYVARFATSRAKLLRYLARKIGESHWVDDMEPMAACEAVADRMERLKYLDDQQYASMRGGAMTRRGLGVRRVKAQLHVDGIGAADAGEAIAAAEKHAVSAALRFAQRRRLGPFSRAEAPARAAGAMEPARGAGEKQLAAFIRAGHAPALARRILAIMPGDAAALAELDAEMTVD